MIMSYALFLLTVLSCIGLAFLTASQPSLSGDNAMGYGLGLVFFGLAFAVTSLVLTLFMLAKGNFQWVAADRGARVVIVLLCWIFVVLTTFFCAAFKWEWHNQDHAYPEFLRWLAVGHGQIWIPLVWFTACFLSLGTDVKMGMSFQKISFYASMFMGGIYTAGLIVGYLRESANAFAVEAADRQQQEDHWHREIMASIEAHQPTDPIVGLLTQTSQVRPADTREAALAKVKTHPHWEAEILALLSNKNTYREVYYFLDGNAVTQPDHFARPLNESILWLAATIKNDIKDSNNLQDWSFDMYQIENLLRAIDQQFLNRGVDFVPNIVQLQQALTTTPPERFKGVRFNITHVVDAWLKKRTK
jgi:hypothetical protein